MSDDDGAWFAAKRYGYGAGLPIHWRGWAFLAAFMVVVVSTELAFAHRHWLIFALLLAVEVAAFVWVAPRHTRGGWRWRWGGER